MSPWQSDLYTHGISKMDSTHEFVGNLMHLRQVLNHPYHLVEGDLPVGGSSGDRLLSASGKFELLDRLLPRLVAFKHKILIFAQMTTLLDMLELLLARRGIRFERIDGSTILRKRTMAADSFQRDPDVSVLLLTTRAGGVGLNLQAADTVVLFDSDWNPQVDLQAMDRAHRIGQYNPVLVIRLAVPVLLDRGVLSRANSKLDVEQKVIGFGRFSGRIGPEDGPGRLEQIISEARQKENGQGRVATPLDEVNRLLARSAEERAAWDASDLELLGPPAAKDDGTPETLEERLERAGRLLGADDVQSDKFSQPAFKRLRTTKKRNR
mmetsp:Transcript_178524/g.572129  ORF Transcript_178524/g.572129 Transcript_178524/m.572129 type:complete len:323 (-) Transcript_178524:136-1104(-)